MEATLLNASADGVGPAVLLSHPRGKAQYLINVPEGFARLVLEHKIRPTAKLACVVLTGVHPLAAGGIGALILRLALDGHGQLQLIGPRGAVAYVHSLRHLFRWRHPKVFVSECTREHAPIFEDDYVVITSLLSGSKSHRCPCCIHEEKLQRRDCPSEVDWTISNNQEADLPDIGEDSNPVYLKDPEGHIHSPTEETTETGFSGHILGYSCFLKELNAAVLILDILDCSALKGLATFQCQKHPRGIAAVIHLSPRAVLQAETYISWMKSCEAFHVPINAGAPEYGYRASLKIMTQLNVIDQELFPLPHYDESGSRIVNGVPRCLSRLLIEKHDSGFFVRLDHSNCLSSFSFRLYQEDFLRFQPQMKDKVLSSIREGRPEKQISSNQLAAEALRQNLRGSAQSARKLALQSSENDFELLFLGTGSAEPSKCRGSSGLLLRLEKSAMLLDAGEGVLGQIVRRYGEDEALQLLQSLECMWLSHKHADHVLGAVAVISSRKVQSKPLLVVGSTAVGNWLTEVRNAVESSGYLLPTFEFIHFEELTAVQREMHQPEWLRCMLEKLQLRSIVNIPVNHCYQAYGAVLVGQSGWRLVYSGDTRPSERLIQAGAGCTLLIHEATFEDSLESHARTKRHSTVTEALQVGREMQAEEVILTHFSQRYPKVVEVDRLKFPDSSTAFDGMAVKLSNLKRLKSIQSFLSLALVEDPSIPRTDWQPHRRKRRLPLNGDGSFETSLPKPPEAVKATQPAAPKHIRWSDSDSDEG